MKKSHIVIYVMLICFFSCRSWDATMMYPKTEPISPKLLTLEKKFEDISNATFVANSDELEIFTKEVENNLVDPYGEKYGYIAFKRNILDVKAGMGYFYISAILATIPKLFGMPYMNWREKVEVEIRILDRDSKLIRKYSAIGTSSVKVAYYYGYSLRAVGRKGYADALNDALKSIRMQIQADVITINEKLKAAGKL